MNAINPQRGRRALSVRHPPRSGSPGRIARLVAPLFHRMLDRIDDGLERGALEASLPDGTRRLLGGRAAGPACVVDLHDWRALIRLASGGSAGWYRAWAAGQWSSPDPVPLFALFMANAAALGRAARPRGPARWIGRFAHWARRNSRSGSRHNIAYHYDLGNDFYTLWLDEHMHYSSALFLDPDSRIESLEQAQRRKVDAILDRLDLRDGDALLEIGCGWGGLAEQAMERRALSYTGLTLSTEQADYARDRLGSGAHILLTDYRDAQGQYDAIASVEMVEAVGQRYWPAYLAAIHRLLKPGGRAAIQYILIDDAIFDGYARAADFIQTYIFPGGMLLSQSRFRALAQQQGLEWRDEHRFGLHYAETLRRWRQRFDRAIDEGRLPASFDQHFVALWRYYLMYCEGGFRGGGIDVAQVTLVKPA
ncbi:cyclopropane-fatty-acyl-phospholipid synthase family protein [Sphingobium sp. HBC34]|uniref:Cyclopropane-fatty-acyl-phospholipid synthase family protein n=1 Tax=Sphingobium cyanobacteriorum TaxID=3063954 RepID=A0ABT8ZMN4_9SPHN|nr:cyclopropane-fatty-acyl-phospholipid synthase family protein [Sphingobium sp. HBC34]MDO7835239.1 cyclopropane-fatty-acyl-phospholipid synthase family protein [Sphingobium sp. HBC34]